MISALEKEKCWYRVKTQSGGGGEGLGRKSRLYNFNRSAQGRPRGKGALEQRLKGDEEARHVAVWTVSVLIRRHSQGRDPKVSCAWKAMRSRLLESSE